MIQTDQGYSIIDGVFARTDMERVLEGLSSAALARTKAGARHVLGVRVVQDLAADRRMLTIATEFVGPGAVPFRATLFDKSRIANWLVVWHQDTALPLRERFEDTTWGPWSSKAGVLYAHAPSWALEQVVALRVSLDDSSSTNGPLRVLPNTHLGGVLTDAAIEQLVRNVTQIDCVARAGGVVAIRPLTVHASSKSVDDQPRRVLHIEYAATMDLGVDIRLAVA
jgi:ectoine hydroxylase-related dioxygenase (phytanoyl-CoA dioxygenase family)